MVGPSFSDDDRVRTSRLLKIGFVLLVAISGALIAYQSGADGGVIAASFGGGLVAGAVLTWFVARNLREIQPEGLRERRERERTRRERERRERERKRHEEEGEPHEEKRGRR